MCRPVFLGRQQMLVVGIPIGDGDPLAAVTKERKLDELGQWKFARCIPMCDPAHIDNPVRDHLILPFGPADAGSRDLRLDSALGDFGDIVHPSVDHDFLQKM